MRQDKTVKFEITLIILGVVLVASSFAVSYLISLNAQKDNFTNFQSVVNDNIEIRQLLIQMSNNIRDRMLLIHDINYSTDAFEIDELTLKYRGVAQDFMAAREVLLSSSLSDDIKTKLNELSQYLRNGRIILDKLVEAKNTDNDTRIDSGISEARDINIKVLSEIDVLIQQQLKIANEKLTNVKNSNIALNSKIQLITPPPFFLSLIVVFYISRALRNKQAQLNKAMMKLEVNNTNLEHIVNERTEELLLLQADHARIRAEIDVSKTMQQLILPPKSELRDISILDIATWVEPAEEMSGDYIDVLPMDNGYLIAIGDVTDHGLKSSILMLMIQSMIRHISHADDINLTKAMSDLNLSLYQNIERMKSDRHLSLSLMHYHDNTVTITGQHEAIIIVRRDGRLEQHSTEYLGMPVGLIDDISEFVDSMEIKLEQGDLMFLHTDGITEAANTKEELYGFGRLCQMAVKHHHLPSEEIIKMIVDDLAVFTEGKTLYDDVALMAIKQN